MLAVPGGAEGDTAEAQGLFTKGLFSTSPQGPSSGQNAHRNTGGIPQSRVRSGHNDDSEGDSKAQPRAMLSPPRNSLSPYPGALSPRSDTGKSEAESASQCDSESGDDTGRRGKMYKYAGYSPSTKRKITKRVLSRGGGGGSSDAAELSKLLASSIRDLEGKEARDREKYRSDALEFGMKLVEEERKRSDEEYSILAKRIEFLTKELEESKRQHQMKSRECDELLEVAEELARGTAPGLDESTNSIASSFSSPAGRRNWLQSPDSSALSPGSGYAYGSPCAGRYREEIADTGTPRGVQTKREGRERGCRACSMGSGESWGDMFSWMFKW